MVAECREWVLGGVRSRAGSVCDAEEPESTGKSCYLGGRDLEVPGQCTLHCLGLGLPGEFHPDYAGSV